MFFSFKPIITINLPQENNRQIRNPGETEYGEILESSGDTLLNYWQQPAHLIYF